MRAASILIAMAMLAPVGVRAAPEAEAEADRVKPAFIPIAPAHIPLPANVCSPMLAEPMDPAARRRGDRADWPKIALATVVEWRVSHGSKCSGKDAK